MNKAEEIKQILLKIQQMSDPGSAENAIIDMKILAGNGLKLMEQSATHPKEGSAGVWRKASEGLPDKVRVNVKYKGYANIIYNYKKDEWCFDDSEGMIVFPKDWEHIEWLDESQSSASPTADGMEGGWISVEDRLPEGIYVPCLVCNMDAPEYNKHVFVASFFGQTKSFSTDNKFIGTITHWRPLPAPPTTP